MDQERLSRRAFLGRAWMALGTLAVGETAYLSLRYIGSRKTDGVFGQVVDAGTIDTFAPGTVTLFQEARFFLVRFPDGGFLALHTRCTHLACVVAWDADHTRFNCPCHGSEFDQTGEVLKPPAPRSLDRFPITFDADHIQVDTSTPLKRDPDLQTELVYVIEADS